MRSGWEDSAAGGPAFNKQSSKCVADTALNVHDKAHKQVKFFSGLLKFSYVEPASASE